jgi:hypothetical protein
MSHEKIPESREVYEHGNRMFDLLDDRYAKAGIFVLGTLIGMGVMAVIWIVSP